MTYFRLQIQPSFSTSQRELRELHHLAAVMDALRSGKLLEAGDALARFIAIHQSLLDSNWHTARHMELYPMDEGLAASPALVLATRKHSKLVQKTQGTYSEEGAYNRGRGR